MSITDELRAYAGSFYLFRYKDVREKIDAIADSIDAEHESACAAAYGNGVESVVMPDLTKYAKLPVDADGEVIRIGDVMEWIDLDGEVSVTCSVDAVGVGCFFAWDKNNGRYAQKCANAYRHYHEPTVEDVLTEFAVKLIERGELTNGAAQTIAEYAAKLRLADDGKEQ